MAWLGVSGAKSGWGLRFRVWGLGFRDANWTQHPVDTKDKDPRRPSKLPNSHTRFKAPRTPTLRFRV